MLSMTISRSSMIALLMTAVSTFILQAQQLADTSYRPVLKSPEYQKGAGPVIYMDEGHNNFHTSTGRYLPFATLLRADGYRVSGLSGDFSSSLPPDARILVIANALNSINVQNWFVPTPSAFTDKEISFLKKWVRQGGSLFLIADHMPFGGAADKLARAFGFSFTNGFAVDTLRPGPASFTRDEKMLLASPVTDGRSESERVNKAVTFTGQAFRAPAKAMPVLRFDERYQLLESDTAWVFDKSTRITNVDGWLQGACMDYGKGRIVFFGEAAMFTAQIAGPNRVGVGLNSPDAPENQKLLLNIIHWLDRRY